MWRWGAAESETGRGGVRPRLSVAGGAAESECGWPRLSVAVGCGRV